MDRQTFQLLYQKYLSGLCTPEELEAFQQFLLLPEAEPLLREMMAGTYESIRKHSATLVDADGNLVPAPDAPPLPHRLPRKRRMIRAWNIAWAIGVVMLAGYAVWLFRDPAGKAGNEKLRRAATARSEIRKIVLPDSSVVWLNADSHLDFPARFGTGNREVTLSGEASFDIRHAAEHPFVIYTGTIRTKVLGTAFNINAYPGEQSVTVSVSRGRVQVIRDRDTLATLVKGQELKVARTGAARPLRRSVAAEGVAAWQAGFLDYDDQTLAEVVTDLGRVFDAEIRIGNPKLEKIRISTRLRKEEGLPQALEILRKLTESTIIHRDNMYFIQ